MGALRGKAGAIPLEPAMVVGHTPFPAGLTATTWRATRGSLSCRPPRSPFEVRRCKRVEDHGAILGSGTAQRPANQRRQPAELIAGAPHHLEEVQHVDRAPQRAGDAVFPHLRQVPDGHGLDRFERDERRAVGLVEHHGHPMFGHLG